MTEETTSAELTPFAVPHDWFLQSLVNMANDGIEIGVTLQVSGLLVSGVLAGGKSYFEGFAEDFSSGLNDPEAAESVRGSFAKYGEIYKKEGDDAPPLPQYIHLKNARFFNTSGNPIPGNKGVWWRGRISEVAGFTLGSLGQVEG
ncbi:gas vesicle protein [Ferrigenium kumadai]|uniref:Gas vesicle protein n=1 Tax=Ferrigenium kumadai TaxID=1682490 RepID=A0AAN1VZF7_9PROT|nr:gas vesicle accessory protein GvpU [Ferrigenium kumadai]BBI98466.1 gas vesicle protein [Ferrigenium kumadai]